MSTGLLIVLIAVGVILIAYVALMLWMYSKAHKPNKKENVETDATEPNADAANFEQALNAAPTESNENNEPVEEAAEETAEEEAAAEPAIEEERILIMMEDLEDRMKQYSSIPFTDKISEQSQNVQAHFNSVYNEFKSYKKMHARVSKKCVTFRFGRELVAKIFIKGKTMKIALALAIDEFPENVYHQKDMSAKKAFEEIPFTVKLKSDRSAKHALALVTALAEKKGMVKNPKYVPVDGVAEIKAAFNAKNKKTTADEQPSQEAQGEMTEQAEQIAQAE